MPSVCKNSEKLPTPEMETPYKACISAIEKKVRNLEKRKGKLDSYREKLTRGEKLDKDQKEAVDKYETVIASMEFAKELQKQFQTMSDDADKLAEKLSKKQGKREKLERQQQEMERLSEVLRLQALLDNLGTDEVRTDLLSGKYSSLAVTEQNLTHLDEFYQLVASTIDGGETSFATQLSTSCEHLLSYLDRADKSVVNTTYKELHELVDLIGQSGFFDTALSSAAGEVTETTMIATDPELVMATGGSQREKEEQVAETTEPAQAFNAQPLETAEQLPAVIDPSLVLMSKSELTESQFEMVSVSESLSVPSGASVGTTGSLAGMPWYQQGAMSAAEPSAAVAAAAAAAAAAAGNQNRQQRPLQDIVSSLQGSYNFLQDSEIDAESSFDRMNFAASQEQQVAAAAAAAVAAYAAYMPQQVVTQQPDLHHFSGAAANPPTTYPNGSYVAAHHHQVALQQEPSYVVVGHDPQIGEVQYAYTSAAAQSGYMPPGVMTMSSPATVDVTAVQQQTTLAQGKATPPLATLESNTKLGVGGGDMTENMASTASQLELHHQQQRQQHHGHQQQHAGIAPPSQHTVHEQHQGFDSEAGHVYSGGYGGGRGGRGNSYGPAYSGAARAPNRGGPYGGQMSGGPRGAGGNPGYRASKPR